MWVREQRCGLCLRALVEPLGQATTRKSSRVSHVVGGTRSLAALLAELLIFVFLLVQLAHCPWPLFTGSDFHGLMSSQTVKRLKKEQVQLQPEGAHFSSSMCNRLFLCISWDLPSATKVIQQGLRVLTVSLLL